MKHAFSLIELSIVLVILGLLTGGILTGQSLIRAAELRTVSTEFSQYVTAAQTFRDKYFALPGDMRNATDFWGMAAGTAGNDHTCRNALDLDSTTCNGNGDGRIEEISGILQREYLLFWDHLALAGLIAGSYSGTTGQDADSGCTSSVEMNAGCNVPTAKVDSAAYWHAYTFPTINASNTASFSGYYYGSYGNVFEIGKAEWYSNGKRETLSNEEMWNIDRKMDDGSPGLGRVKTYRTCMNWPHSATDATPEDAEYELDRTDENCGLIFIY